MSKNAVLKFLERDEKHAFKHPDKVPNKFVLKMRQMFIDRRKARDEAGTFGSMVSVTSKSKSYKDR